VQEPARPRGGRGRPARLWGLDDRAEACFADGHATLCLTLAGALRASLRPSALRRVLETCAHGQAQAYRERLLPHKRLGPRVRALAAEREAEGYMVQVRRAAAGGYLLIQNHCPVGQAARVLPELCAAEQRALRQALGHVTVTLTEHRLQGAARCALEIRPRAAR
jgi:predicted ArsR family transcriptional regulator